MQGEGGDFVGFYGGNIVDDDSGSLRYMVVKYAGSNVDPENQLNGIAFQGVGSGTTVEYIEVFNNLDDGVEFFGGTAEAKYLVVDGGDSEWKKDQTITQAQLDARGFTGVGIIGPGRGQSGGRFGPGCRRPLVERCH